MPSAGQVEQYAYCAHNWWLARHGEEGDGAGATRGISDHKRLGKAQTAAEADKEESRDGLDLSIRLILLAASLTALIVLVVPNGLVWWRQVTLAVLALVLVSGSAALLSIGLLAQRRYRALQREHGLAPGKLLASDLASQAPLLSDPAWGLNGRPDYLLSTQQGTVPVEVKTGKTPAHPFQSHVLQVACYLRLLEARDGKPPPYGLVQYPTGFFRIEWTPELKDALKAQLEAMRAAEAAGKADRDHEQPGRCRGCSRRDACTQKLE